MLDAGERPQLVYGIRENLSQVAWLSCHVAFLISHASSVSCHVPSDQETRDKKRSEERGETQRHET